jgi:hypothetical protein
MKKPSSKVDAKSKAKLTKKKKTNTGQVTFICVSYALHFFKKILGYTWLVNRFTLLGTRQILLVKNPSKVNHQKN